MRARREMDTLLTAPSSDADAKPGTPVGETPQERMEWVERYVANTTRILDERAWPKKGD